MVRLSVWAISASISSEQAGWSKRSRLSSTRTSGSLYSEEQCDAAGLRNGFYGILISAGVLEASTAQGDGYGFVVENSTVIGNTSVRNAHGLFATRSVYGSNSLQGNEGAQDVIDGGGAVSQNNNICTSGQC